MNTTEPENNLIFKSVQQVLKDSDNHLEEMKDFLLLYTSAIREVKTKLEVLDDEFKIKRQRNPIEYLKSRTKTPQSIMSKLQRKGLEVSVESARKNLHDIAGVRVICSFLDDIYKLADTLINQDDIILLEKKDYIKNPKPNGYRSLHLVIQIPVFFSDHVEHVPVEVQIRTIAMDFWASLEHKLYYKKIKQDFCGVREELKECADIIASTDLKMLEIQKQVDEM